jgi:hypothetical protein
VPFQSELMSEAGTRRQQLARWITDPGNPYFARAIVNRVWALLLGKPLLDPVDDPSGVEIIPPALQILADDFVAHGHDLRRLIRIIAMSDVFRLDSAAAHELTDAHEVAWAAYPLSRLRPEQVVGGILQSASLTTINADSPLLIKLFTAIGERDFVKRYGDTGEDEFSGKGGTIPQRLLLMNGELVHDKIKDSPFNAAARIASLAPDDATAVRVAYLSVLTRVPTVEEMHYFEARLADTSGKERKQRLEDLYWALINSTEFAWNH